MDLLIDMATLTGAQLTATGTRHAGIVTNSDALERTAVLTGRLTEATVALADVPIRELGPYVAMVKDMALAIQALKSL